MEGQQATRSLCRLVLECHQFSLHARTMFKSQPRCESAKLLDITIANCPTPMAHTVSELAVLEELDMRSAWRDVICHLRTNCEAGDMPYPIPCKAGRQGVQLDVE